MPTPTLRGINSSWDSDTFMACSEVTMPSVSPGASVATTTVQSAIFLPWNYKIRKVSVMVTAIDAVDGSDTFNLVLGGIPAATGAYNQNNPVLNDNSQSGPGTASTPAGLGYPTNIGVAGQTVFANDVPFLSTNTYGAGSGGTSNLTGYGYTNTGWVTLATTGGYGIFVPTYYDGVYPCTVPLTLRVKTNASTGSITTLQIRLSVVPIPLRKGPIPSSSTVIWGVPGQDF